ncbi:hypothetical protein Gasu2_28750 [Galdieria sulphuraria]|uniref:Uncharacterized protein n=1 Tax=Galdieria sulphuraria TaxID=130081 RepID=M2XYQ3_GALSU|nr:hypothetical protein Gasu_39920 isoform 1 [Galdieria sulphuraria]EME28619.1 hypothetical protein Gasu_39920 isoform 1 [Galdieria sulphuraria]GJD08581.1 hypothetical protein Gasu2_28750 [Galdieria sulphuraria]|eukprot:XP_005705139.1 hypothetical protein isoform 1 [Galdieria sulphuraria]
METARWKSFYKRLPKVQQTLSFFQRPATIAFSGGFTFAFFYAVVVRNEWQTHMNQLKTQLNRSKQKWQNERLSLDAKVSRLELRLNRTELELTCILESAPKNGSNWSKSVIESKYDECMANKK